jgi:hypothetical protein
MNAIPAAMPSSSKAATGGSSSGRGRNAIVLARARVTETLSRFSE